MLCTVICAFCSFIPSLVSRLHSPRWVKKLSRFWERGYIIIPSTVLSLAITPVPSSLPLSQLQFRYATAFDLLLLLVGTLLSILQGCGLPLMVILFGGVTNAFINQAATQDFVTPNSSLAVSCASTVSNTSNIPLNDFVDALSRNITTGAVDCEAEAFGVTLDDLLQICFTNHSQCLPDDRFIAVINQQVLWFVALAVAVLVAGFVQISFFQVACERQVNRIRLYYYRAVMRQDIGWFDGNPSGELSSRLSE